MKSLLAIVVAISSFLSAASQKNSRVTSRHPKIKNDNVLIVPDQKPVIIERKEDVIIPKKSVPPGQAKKLYRAKSAKAFAPGQLKKRRYSYKIAKRKKED